VNKLQKNIPNHWKWVTLDDISVTSSGGTPDRKNSKNFIGDIPWVKSGELNYNIITETEESINQEALDYSSAKIFPKGSLLIALYGNTVGRMAFLGVDASTNQAIASITPFLVNPKYLYYFLMSSKEELLNKREGSAQPNISQKVLNSFPFPLTPIEEQNRIVEKIEELFSELDKNIVALNDSENKTELSKIKILDRYYSSNAKEEKLISLTHSIDYGFTAKSFKQKKDANNIHYLRITDIQNGEINWDNVPFCEAEHNAIEKYKIEVDDILFARSGNTVGKTILINNPPNSLFASYLIRIRVNKQIILPKFLYYYFQSNKYWQLINNDVTGIGQPNFNGTKLSNLSIPVPNLSEQKIIIEKIEDNFNELNNLKFEIKISIKNTQILKNKILQEAFLGKLSTKLNTDSSTESFLKEIKICKEKYLIKQQETIKNRPKIKRMEKEKLSIIQVLEKHKKPISSIQLWEDSMFSNDIENFYAELKKVQNKIKQEKIGSETLISLV
jgi:type I restriction enzyme, S subunit